MKLYLSGPITGNPNAVEQFAAAERRYASLGEVINPLKGSSIHTPWHEAMRRDIVLLMQCDAIVMLRGWHASRGAVLERHIASQLGMQLIYDSYQPDFIGILTAAIYDITGISYNQLKSKSRQRDIVDARHIFFKLLRDYTSWSTPLIGSLLDRDHCTVLHALNKCESLIRVDRNFHDKFQLIHDNFLDNYEKSISHTNQYHSSTFQAAAMEG